MNRRFLATVTLALGSAASCGGPPGDRADPGDAGVDAVEPPADAVVPGVPPEVDGRIVINEVMASNAFTIVDGNGNRSDWLELSNPNDENISLRGYGVTDDLTMPHEHVLPGGLVVPAHGKLVLWADGGATGSTHVALHLAKEGGELGLSRPDGTWIDRVQYAGQETDLSAAREPDGSDRWVIEWHPTPGQHNQDGAGVAVGLEDISVPPEQLPAAGDLTEQLLGFDQMPELALDIEPADAASLRADPFTYVPAKLHYGGRRFGPVGVRLKGGNSFEAFDDKPSLKISLDQYVADGRLLGVKNLTLDNMDGDYSMMHERLSYLIAREAGVPASRSNHALLTVNGHFYGLYANVESMKKSLLARWFTDNTGPLFEQFDVDYIPADVAMFELESGSDDRTLLTGLAQALTIGDPDQAIAAAGAYADIAAFQQFWAMCTVVGQYDSFPYSIPGDDVHVYADPTSGRLHFLPWGMDETFYSALVDPVASTYSVLAARCKASPACFQGYVDDVWAMLDLTDQLDLEAVRQHVIQQIAPYVAADTRKPYTDADVAAYQQNLYWFIAERRQDLAAVLPPRQ